MKPSKIEEPSRSRPPRYSGLPDERKFSRHLLFGLFLVFAYVGVVALLDRLVSTGGWKCFYGPAFGCDGALSGVERMD